MKKKQPSIQTSLIPAERIVGSIFLIRDKKVMLDRDLAELYGVKTAMLNRAVRRNIKRFPEDFMLQLNEKEFTALRYQIGTSNEATDLRSQIGISKGRGGRRYLPLVFTEHGVAMLSSVLNSERAIMVNIQIIRTFVRLREMLATHKDLKNKVEEMERKYDKKFRVIFDAIKQLIAEGEKPKRELGFRGRNE